MLKSAVVFVLKRVACKLWLQLGAGLALAVVSFLCQGIGSGPQAQQLQVVHEALLYGVELALAGGFLTGAWLALTAVVQLSCLRGIHQTLGADARMSC